VEVVAFAGGELGGVVAVGLGADPGVECGEVGVLVGEVADQAAVQLGKITRSARSPTLVG
jgi:hypothetical protein